MIFSLKYTKIQIFTSRRRFSDFQNRKKSNFGLGPKIKPGLRIFSLEIEFFSKNIIFLLDIIFLSLKIALNSDENCGFHLRKCAKFFFSKNNLSNVVVVATFIRLKPNFRRRSSDNIKKFDIL